jgi:phosphatidylserine/phosphatidylglycerophosphate/cardiolipin synthase-like enzyme
MYEFTNPFLFDELVAALNRNILVRLFMEGAPIGGMDDRQQHIVRTLASQGAFVRFMVSDYENHVYARYQFNHAKYLIIDNKTVIVESANWAKTGIPKDPTFGNREWGVVVRDTEVAGVFSQVFQVDWNPNMRDSYPIEAMNFLPQSDFDLDYDVPLGAFQPCFSAQTIPGPSYITPVFSPDNSEKAILDVIDNATSTIYIQQLYIYPYWEEGVSPLMQHLINKSHQNVSIYVILDYNPAYEETIVMLDETKQELESHGIQVKYISSEWSPFSTVHNKGMIVDNTTVFISSINWNEQSIRKNREAGVLLNNKEAAAYFATVFFSDWALEASKGISADGQSVEYKYLLLIAVVFGITVLLIVQDWRKRKWR